jgi:hypothetical protein
MLRGLRAFVVEFLSASQRQIFSNSPDGLVTRRLPGEAQRGVAHALAATNPGCFRAGRKESKDFTFPQTHLFGALTPHCILAMRGHCAIRRNRESPRWRMEKSLLDSARRASARSPGNNNLMV